MSCDETDQCGNASADTIVIGFGNVLRRDDGIGPYVAAQIEAQHLPGVRTLAVHQLTPDLAEDLSAARAAIFVDAHVGAGWDAIEIHHITPGGARSGMSHACDPRVFLELTLLLYGRAADGWVVNIAGQDFGIGEGLSDVAKQYADRAVDRIVALLSGACKAALP